MYFLVFNFITTVFINEPDLRTTYTILIRDTDFIYNERGIARIRVDECSLVTTKPERLIFNRFQCRLLGEVFFFMNLFTNNLAWI